MAGNMINNPRLQFLDGNGAPFALGTLGFFDADAHGTPLNTYSDKELSSANPNPITLDAAGRPANGGTEIAVFLLQQSYYVVLKDSAGTEIWDADDVSNILQVDVTGIATVLTIVALQALLKVTLSDLEIRYIFGRVNKNDGAGGYFQWNASSSATVNLGTVFPSGEGGTGRWIRINDRPLTLPMFGALGDGSNDDAAALESAIITSSTEELELFIPTPAVSYDLATQKTIASISGPLRIVGEGLSKFTWGAARAAGRALLISDTNGHDVFISGIQFDGLTNITEFLRVDNPSANMNDASIGVFEIKDVLIENLFMPVGASFGAEGFAVLGGFSEARAINVTVRNVDRATGAGTPGSQGCTGFAFTHNGINQYIKRMVAVNCTIDTITNSETTGTGDDVDCDGIKMFGPDPSTNGNKPVGHTALINSCVFRDCKGRGIKTQCTTTTVLNPEFHHDLEEGITNQHDIDAQQGTLLVQGGTIFLNEKSGGGTTMGTSYNPIAASMQGITTDQNNETGSVIVDRMTVICSIPTSVDDSIPIFIATSNAVDSEPFRSIKITNITLLGNRFQRFAKFDVGTNESDIIVRGNTCLLANELILLNTMGSFSEVNIFISENTQTGSTPRSLVNDATPFNPYISSHSNIGFTENLGDELVSDVHSEVFRPLQIGMRDRTAAGVSLQLSQSLSDDVSYEFPTTGTSFGVATIVSTHTLEAMGIFAFDNGGLADLLGGASTNIAYGATANPDTDGKLNVWFNTTNDTVNIKNRLGSGRQFNLYMKTGS